MTIIRNLKRWGLLLLGGFFCYLVFCEFFLLTHVIGGMWRPLSSLVAIPAASAKGEVLTYRQTVELAHGLKGFAGVKERRLAFDQALSSGVYRLYVEALAEELHVTVSQSELRDYPLDIDVIGPGLELAKWSENDYRKYVVASLLLAQVTDEALSLSEIYQGEARDSMESLRKKVAQGMPFTDVALNFSEDPSALSRGDLGVMSLEAVPDWLKPGLALEPGELSGVLEAPDALWTVTMIETFSAESGSDSTAVHFRGIAVKKRSLGVVIADMMTVDPPWVNVW